MNAKAKKVTKKPEASEVKEGCACQVAGKICSCCGDKKRLCIAVIIGLLVAVVFSAIFGRGVCDKKVNALVETYIKENPSVILESIDTYLRKKGPQPGARPQEAKEAPADMVKEIISDKTNSVLGNPKGKFVIIEFFDYQCGWCKKTNAEISQVLKDAPNIRWILIDSPIFGPSSELISKYALAAGKQGKFKEMHEAIASAKGKLDEEALVTLGKTVGLNVDTLKKDANGDEVKERLAKNKTYAQKMNVAGVPMLIVDGKVNPGALIGEKLQAAVKASQSK